MRLTMTNTIELPDVVFSKERNRFDLYPQKTMTMNDMNIENTGTSGHLAIQQIQIFFLYLLMKS